MDKKRGLILVLDMESALADSLAKRVIDMNQFLILRAWDMKTDPEAELATYKDHLRGIIISGSAKSINGKTNPIPQVPQAMLGAGVPILGICYGMQYLAHVMGVPIIRCWNEQDPAKRTKEAAKKDKGEYGPTIFRRTADSPLFHGLGQEFPVWMKHNWMLGDLPPNWTHTGRTDKCPIAAMERGNIYALQFHPEPGNSLFGRTILHNFFTHICGLQTPYF